MSISKRDREAIENFRRMRQGGELPSRMTYIPKNLKEKLKMDLCESLVIFREREQISQKELSSLAEITEAQVSEIFNYRIERFTIDFLIDVIEKINSCKKVSKIDLKKIAF